jgi:hypothetical protein
VHALLGDRLRGRAARRAEPRRPHRDRDVRGRALPLTILGQRDRSLRRCPHVGSTASSAPGRQDVPTGMACPVGCNISATIRGEGQRVLSRNHPESIADGSATRALLLSAPARGDRIHRRCARPEGGEGDRVGRGARLPREMLRTARRHRDRALGSESRDRVRAGPAPTRRTRRALGRLPGRRPRRSNISPSLSAIGEAGSWWSSATTVVGGRQS